MGGVVRRYIDILIIITMEPVLMVTCEGRSPCIRRSVRKVPAEFSMRYIHFYIVYNGLPVLSKAAASWSHNSIIIMAYNLSCNSHTKYGYDNKSVHITLSPMELVNTWNL